jgi:putative transposase
MPIPTRLIARFSPGDSCHVICKCIEGKQLFYTDTNRRYFIKRYFELLDDFVETYAYCLLNNHVHWLIKTKSEHDILTYLGSGEVLHTTTHKKFINGACDFHELIEQQFNRLFISYTATINHARGVKGHLFNRPFKRIEIVDDQHFSQLIVYIHANAQKHAVVGDFRDYPWSSYQDITGTQPTYLQREELLKWFGGQSRFVDFHVNQAEHYYQHLFSGE